MPVKTPLFSIGVKTFLTHISAFILTRHCFFSLDFQCFEFTSVLLCPNIVLKSDIPDTYCIYTTW